MDSIRNWFFKNLIFIRGRPITPIGFPYNHHHFIVFGIAPENTGGFLRISALESTGITFTQPAILIRVELTISVRENTANAYAGAAIVRQPPIPDAATGIAQLDATSSRTIILGNITTQETAVISKNFNLGLYSGARFNANERLQLGYIGDANAIIGMNANLHWVYAPGQELERADPMRDKMSPNG